MSFHFVNPVQRKSRTNSTQKQFAQNVQAALTKAKAPKAPLPYGVSSFGGSVRNFDSIALLPSKLAAEAKRKSNNKKQSTAGTPKVVKQAPKKKKPKKTTA